MFGEVSKYKLTASGIEKKLIDVEPEDMRAEFKKHTDIDLTDEQLQTLLSSRNYKEGNYMEVANSPNLTHNIVNIMNSRMCFGFTTGGHTGEEVLLAAYHPEGDLPMDILKYRNK